jgi:hypothetical protein
MRLLIAIGFSLLAAASPFARQADPNADLRTQLSARYDILSLQNGVGLVPKDRNAAFRLIEVRDGGVAVDGQSVTGRELRDKIGADADLILRLSYMPLAEQRQIAGAETSAAGAAPVSPPPQTPSRQRSRRSDDIVRMGGSVDVGADEVVSGDVVVIGGNARIDGEVEGDVNVVGGNATLGPESVISGDLNVVGGTLTRAPGSRVDGSVNEVGGRFGAASAGAMGLPMLFGSTLAGRIGSFAGTLARVGLIVLLVLAAMAFGRNAVNRIADHAAVDPVRAGLVGFLAELLFLPTLILTVVILAVSIIGIPLLLLLPFALVIAVGVMVVGFTGVAVQLGRWLNSRFGWTERGPYRTALLGVLAIVLLTVLARSAAIIGGRFLTFPLSAAGIFIEYLAWTLGLGAAIQTWLQHRRVPPATAT